MEKKMKAFIFKVPFSLYKFQDLPNIQVILFLCLFVCCCCFLGGGYEWFFVCELVLIY